MLLKYRFQKVPAKPTAAYPDRHSDLWPLIPIRLYHGTKHLDVEALIDSGAADCIFHAEIAEYLGLEVKNEKTMKHMGVGGQVIASYFHDIVLELGGHYQFPCYAGFSYDVQPKPALLGRRGFLEKFAITFDLARESIEIKWK